MLNSWKGWRSCISIFECISSLVTWFECKCDITHCLSSCRPCFQLSWLLGGSGRASFSLPSSKGERSHTGWQMRVNHSNFLSDHILHSTTCKKQAVLTLNPLHAHLSRSWEASCRPGWAPSRTSACGTSPCGGEEDTGSELLLPRRQQLARITESPRTRVGSFYKFPAMWDVFPSWIARTPR